MTNIFKFLFNSDSVPKEKCKRKMPSCESKIQCEQNKKSKIKRKLQSDDISSLQNKTGKF